MYRRDKDCLWQKTDALMSRQQRLNDVKWLDGTNVLNCMGCRAQFGLLLRKVTIFPPILHPA